MMAVPKFIELQDGPVNPLRRLDFRQMDPGNLWVRVEPALDDYVKLRSQLFFQSLLNGQTLLYDFCDGQGLLWMYQAANGVASVSVIFDGSWKKVLATWGDIEDACRSSLRALMEEHDLRKVRAYVKSNNTRAVRLADRWMVREGTLRDEMGGGVDLIVFGALRSEVDGTGSTGSGNLEPDGSAGRRRGNVVDGAFGPERRDRSVVSGSTGSGSTPDAADGSDADDAADADGSAKNHQPLWLQSIRRWAFGNASVDDE